MQLGPGIFATNESVMYHWRSFKAQINLGLRVLLNQYPKLSFFSLNPNYLELRYVDVFNRSLLGTVAMFDFVEKGTSLRLQLPKMLLDKGLFSGDALGRFACQRTLKGWKEAWFKFEIGSGRGENSEEIIQAQTHIMCKSPGVPDLETHSIFLSQINQWLEFAHDIASPFFKELISSELMRKFQTENESHK